jgi:ABC-type lipoprotein release transport system permease subunit
MTYYRRHKRQTLLLAGMIAALTLGVYMLVDLMNSSLHNVHYSFHYLTRMSLVSAGGGLDSGSVAMAGRIRAHESVAHVFPENGLHIYAPLLSGAAKFPVLGITETALPVVMDACDLRLKAGQLIKPRAGEIVLSEELVRVLDLQIGDHISYETNEDYYPTIATELTLVGVLENISPDSEFPARVGFVSFEYLDSHELYQPRFSRLLVIPRPGSRKTLNDFLETLVGENGGTVSVQLETYERENESWQSSQRILNGLYGFTDIIVTMAAALVVGVVNRIAISHRLSEIGLLHAVGYQKRRLVRRLVLETAMIAWVGWGAGLVAHTRSRRGSTMLTS